MLFQSTHTAQNQQKPSGVSNIALFRTTALAGSGLIWGVMGFYALNYVPKIASKPPLIDTTIIATPDPVVVPPPPPIIEPTRTNVRPEPISNTPNPATTTIPTLTARPSQSDLPNPLAGALPEGKAPQAPALTIGGGATTANITMEPPPPVAAPTIIEPPPAPPPPALVINPVRISGSNPIYPPRALDRGVMGEVTLAFRVTPSGDVENIEILGEQPSGYGFARAARAAIQNWRFQPQTIDGVPVAYPARYSFSFKLED